jgi:hypothetical protein
MLKIVVWSAGFLPGAYALGLASRAEAFQLLTLEGLALAWRFQKREDKCKAS